MPASQWQTFDLLYRSAVSSSPQDGSCRVCWQGMQSVLFDVHRLFTATSPQQIVQNEMTTAD